MKAIIKFIWFVACSLWATGSIFASDLDHWLMLSANSQNLARKVLTLRGAQDPGIFNAEVVKINRSLNALVESGALSEQSFSFSYEGSLDEFFDMMARLFDAEDLNEKYGVYTVSEMMDVGKFFRGESLVKNKKVSIHVRLPPKDLATFSGALAALSKNNGEGKK